MPREDRIARSRTVGVGYDLAFFWDRDHASVVCATSSYESTDAEEEEEYSSGCLLSGGELQFPCDEIEVFAV